MNDAQPGAEDAADRVRERLAPQQPVRGDDDRQADRDVGRGLEVPDRVHRDERDRAEPRVDDRAAVAQHVERARRLRLRLRPLGLGHRDQPPGLRAASMRL